jgi:rhodanese-related sulfurtransferase
MGHMIENVSPQEFALRRDAGELWQLLDVREGWEIEIASVSESVDIPMAEIPSRFAGLDKSAPVAVLCHSGVRSARVAEFLAQQGFSRVANIVGGIDAWSANVDTAIPRY